MTFLRSSRNDVIAPFFLTLFHFSSFFFEIERQNLKMMHLLACKFLVKRKIKNYKQRNFSRQTKLVSVTKMRRYEVKCKARVKKDISDLLSKMLCHPILQRDNNTHLSCTKKENKKGPAKQEVLLKMQALTSLRNIGTREKSRKTIDRLFTLKLIAFFKLLRF
jgi:hypothetical protein